MFNGLSGIDLIYLLASLLLATVLHEGMHAYAAHALGDTTAKDMGRLTLNPLKSIDVFTTILLPMVLIIFGYPPLIIARPVPFNPDRVRFDEYGAALVGVAGPFTNLFLAGLAALIVRISSIAIGTEAFQIFSIFISINLTLFVFNMIPVPPLDGSRLLYAFAPEPVQKFMYQIESLGFIAIIAFMFLLFPFISPAVFGIVGHLYRLLLG